MTTPAAPETPYAAAVRLGCTLDELGFCARCHAYCHRYGRNSGGPLCATCRGLAEQGRAKSG
ncbi:MAG: hypothetical protein HOY79_34105 [Streptomyces sp.]|nr:hypothetical protein [Streptomyces sp.]NUS11408.1 hypothetical protein [Streptomyces sp.]NUS23451.1 hypothetical protein [Streptomyces sp.]